MNINKATHLNLARGLVQLLESKFKIGRFKFGLDPIIGLFPVVGDSISAFLSIYIVIIAILCSLPLSKVLRMIFNILWDYVIGSIPIIGDVLDFVINPNTKNLEMLEKHLKEGVDIIEGEIVSE